MSRSTIIDLTLPLNTQTEIIIKTNNKYNTVIHIEELADQESVLQALLTLSCIIAAQCLLTPEQIDDIGNIVGDLKNAKLRITLSDLLFRFK